LHTQLNQCLPRCIDWVVENTPWTDLQERLAIGVMLPILQIPYMGIKVPTADHRAPSLLVEGNISL